jgi:hypothetical protein
LDALISPSKNHKSKPTGTRAKILSIRSASIPILELLKCELSIRYEMHRDQVPLDMPECLFSRGEDNCVNLPEFVLHIRIAKHARDSWMSTCRSFMQQADSRIKMV